MGPTQAYLPLGKYSLYHELAPRLKGLIFENITHLEGYHCQLVLLAPVI